MLNKLLHEGYVDASSLYVHTAADHPMEQRCGSLWEVFDSPNPGRVGQLMTFGGVSRWCHVPDS